MECLWGKSFLYVLFGMVVVLSACSHGYGYEKKRVLVLYVLISNTLLLLILKKIDNLRDSVSQFTLIEFNYNKFFKLIRN